jgi:hypothetical protein
VRSDPWRSPQVNLSIFVPATPTWSIAHPWNASFHFSFLILQSVGFHGQVISPSQGRYLHRTTETQNKRRQTSMPRVAFEPRIPAFERVKTLNSLDGAATVIGPQANRLYILQFLSNIAPNISLNIYHKANSYVICWPIAILIVPEEKLPTSLVRISCYSNELSIPPNHDLNSLKPEIHQKCINFSYYFTVHRPILRHYNKEQPFNVDCENTRCLFSERCVGKIQFPAVKAVGTSSSHCVLK